LNIGKGARLRLGAYAKSRRGKNFSIFPEIQHWAADHHRPSAAGLNQVDSETNAYLILQGLIVMPA